MMAQKNPIVTITMEDGSIMKAELYPDIAPESVNNFISLIKKHFYDGVIFHRVIQNFMIQGGDPEGTGCGGPGYCIKGEFKSNGFQNDLKHTEGVLSMARTMIPDSAGSQFFIMHKTSPHLDGEYAAFGKIIEGMETVNAIAKTATKLRRPSAAGSENQNHDRRYLRRRLPGTEQTQRKIRPFAGYGVPFSGTPFFIV